MLDRVPRSDLALFEAPCRATVVSSSVALPVAAACATSGALVWIERESADWVGMVALAGILAVSALLAAIVRLVVMDRRAEIKSSVDWAAIAAETTTAMLAGDRKYGEHLHQPAVYDEVVQAILPACRHALPRHVIKVVADVGNACSMALPVEHRALPRPYICNVLVASQDEKGPAGSEPALGAVLNGRPTGADPCCRMPASTAPNRARLRHSDDPSPGLAVPVDARHQMVAPAGPLARKAARQDDVAEHVQERSRLRPGRRSSKRLYEGRQELRRVGRAGSGGHHRSHTPAAIYARLLSNLQAVRSIARRGEGARRYIETRSLSGVDGSKHAGILGRSSLNGPGLLGLICDRQAREFDVISTEGLDRLSRSGARADGAISHIHVDLKATLSALLLKVLAQNTRCGQIGRVSAGRIPGGKGHGHHAADDGDDRGRRTIDPAEADILQRIRREYARKELLAIATSRHSNALALGGSPKRRSGIVDKSSTSARSSTAVSISFGARTRRRNGVGNAPEVRTICLAKSDPASCLLFAALLIPRDGSQALCTKVWAQPCGGSYRRKRLAATAWAARSKRRNATGLNEILVG